MEKNIKIIKEEIAKKNSNNPYRTGHVIYTVNTDYDIFPYNRWFKGDVQSSEPKIDEREAGWIPKRKQNLMPKQEPTPLPTTCFQSPCSIVYPCYSNDNNYYLLNKACKIEQR